MHPYIFKVIPSYSLMLLIGIILCLIVFVLYLKKEKVSKSSIIDLLICAIFAIIIGILSSILFDNIYKTIKYGIGYQWTFSMTFIGGLFGGVIAFVLLYNLFYKRNNPPLFDKILIIAPGSICLAHGFGRIGCFLAGCCYGLPTDSWIGITFPGIGKVIPTQLIEAIILFILAIVLLVFAFKKIMKQTMIIYLALYGLARFVIEFYRGDDRGQSSSFLSPSQIWCLIMMVGAVPSYFVFNKFFFKKEENK